MSQRESFAFEKAELKPGDFCIMTTGCMTDSFSLGDMDLRLLLRQKVHEQRAMVKDCLCEAGNGSTGAVFACPEKNGWMSFTVTAREMRF